MEREQYRCPQCETFWEPEDVPSDFQDHEGCPDCLTLCERCGMVKDYHGTYEHCL
jgi:hypothetical protein